MTIKARIPFTKCPKNKWQKGKLNMAYFAQLDENNKVIQVIVVKDDILGEKIFPESEVIGIKFCQSLFGEKTNWKQTSPERIFRKNFAGIGSTYYPELDAFSSIKPYPSWVLNPQTLNWESPILLPDDENNYVWDEISLSWIKSTSVFVLTNKDQDQ